MNSICSPGRRFALTPLALSAALFLAACGGGGDSSSPAAATAVPPTISAQPAEQAVTAGKVATFSVTASGDALAYQWQVSTDGAATWTNIAGATSAAYTVTATDPALNGTKYRVVISSAGLTTTSSPVTLTVAAAITAPVITVDVAALAVTAGADAAFSVTASGSTLTYQWQTSTDGTTFANVAGATGATLTLPAVALTDSGKSVRVAVANSAGTVNSSAAALYVTPAVVDATILSQPTSMSATAPSQVTFTVSAAGSPAPTYLWQKSTDAGVTWVDIAGATAATYTTPATAVADTGSLFRVKATNATATVVSDPATLTVAAAPVPVAITTQPIALAVTVPSTATFSVVASGSPTPTYQWQVKGTATGATFANITGATGASYTTPATVAADSGKQFQVVVTNGSGSVTSAPVALTATAVSPANASMHYYLLTNAGPMVTATSVTAAGNGQFLSSALFAVDSANPSAPPVIVAPAGAGQLVDVPFVEATVVAGQVTNARSRYGVFINADRYYKVDQLVPEGSVPKASMLSNLRASQTCGGPTNSPDTLGWNLAHPDKSWVYFQVPATGNSCSDRKMIAVRLDMDGSGEPRVLPGLPVADIVNADGSFNGLLVDESTTTERKTVRLDNELSNAKLAFAGAFVAKFGATSPGNVLYSSGSQLYAMSLAGSETSGVPVINVGAGETQRNITTDGTDVLVTLIVPQISGPEGTVTRAASYRTIRVTSAFQTSVESAGAGAGPVAPIRVLLNLMHPSTVSVQDFFLSSKPYSSVQLDANGELQLVEWKSGSAILDIGKISGIAYNSSRLFSHNAFPIQYAQPGLIVLSKLNLSDILFYSSAQKGITRVTNFLASQ